MAADIRLTSLVLQGPINTSGDWNSSSWTVWCNFNQITLQDRVNIQGFLLLYSEYQQLNSMSSISRKVNKCKMNANIAK